MNFFLIQNCNIIMYYYYYYYDYYYFYLELKEKYSSLTGLSKATQLNDFLEVTQIWYPERRFVLGLRLFYKLMSLFPFLSVQWKQTNKPENESQIWFTFTSNICYCIFEFCPPRSPLPPSPRPGSWRPSGPFKRKRRNNLVSGSSSRTSQLLHLLKSNINGKVFFLYFFLYFFL